MKTTDCARWLSAAMVLVAVATVAVQANVQMYEDVREREEDTPDKYGGITFALSDDGALRISGEGEVSFRKLNEWKDTNTTPITAVIIESGVTRIGDFAFEEYSTITSVTIPNTVTTIEKWAFYKCSSLTSVTIPKSVTEIKDYAFSSCTELQSVTIQGGVTAMGGQVFSDCVRLKSVTIEEGVTMLGSNTFIGCDSLTSVAIPSSLTDINRAFTGDGLASITVAEGNARYSSADGILFNKDKSAIIQYPPAKQGASYTIPDGITAIGERAFEGSATLTSVTIPNSVDTIGEYAFGNCANLASITVAEGNARYTSVDGIPFSKDKSVIVRYPQGKRGASYKIPEGVTEIGSGAFDGAPLISVAIPDGVVKIGDCAFDGAPLASVAIPNSVSKIGWRAFARTRLKSVAIPPGVVDIGAAAFSDCENLVSVDIPNGVLAIAPVTFSGCASLKSFTVPRSVKTIGMGAFSDCVGLKSVTIPNGVIVIESSAFSYCVGLKSVTIPWSVAEIEYFAFGGCANLRSIIFTNAERPPKIGDYCVFPKEACLYVPKGRAEIYRDDGEWRKLDCVKDTAPPGSTLPTLVILAALALCAVFVTIKKLRKPSGGAGKAWA